MANANLAGFLVVQKITPGIWLPFGNEKRTIIVDIRDDDGKILARMKQKTRNNIRLAC
jgi:hypothetical protein